MTNSYITVVTKITQYALFHFNLLQMPPKTRILVKKCDIISTFDKELAYKFLLPVTHLKIS